jgi:hypothetical protein
MARQPEPLYYEEQKFRQPLRFLTAIPPIAISVLAVWQVGFGHQWGKQPMSNAGIIGWTIFLWAIYLRLMTVKLVTELRPGELRVAMRGVWPTRRISLTDVKSVKTVTYNPLRDWGGYGVRSTRRGKAYIASGEQGVELEIANGGVVLIGSGRAGELAGAIKKQLA